MPSKGIAKRMQRIASKSPGMGKAEVKALAQKRAVKYAAGGKTASSTGGGIGKGKEGTLKRALYKRGGTKVELNVIRRLSKSRRDVLKTGLKKFGKRYDLQKTALNLAVPVKTGKVKGSSVDAAIRAAAGTKKGLR